MTLRYLFCAVCALTIAHMTYTAQQQVRHTVGSTIIRAMHAHAEPTYYSQSSLQNMQTQEVESFKDQQKWNKRISLGIATVFATGASFFGYNFCKKSNIKEISTALKQLVQQKSISGIRNAPEGFGLIISCAGSVAGCARGLWAYWKQHSSEINALLVLETRIAVYGIVQGQDQLKNQLSEVNDAVHTLDMHVQEQEAKNSAEHAKTRKELQDKHGNFADQLFALSGQLAGAQDSLQQVSSQINGCSQALQAQTDAVQTLQAGQVCMGTKLDALHAQCADLQKVKDQQGQILQQQSQLVAQQQVTHEQLTSMNSQLTQLCAFVQDVKAKPAWQKFLGL